jgi:hypothetical protein
MNTALAAFITALATMPTFEREKVMEELLERVCFFCGDPAGSDCPCWKGEEPPVQ